MSGIDRITEKILNQAKLQAENTVSHANEEAVKNRQNLEKRFERTLEHEHKRAEAKGKEAAGRIIANTSLEGRKSRLAARQEIVDRVFEEVKTRLAGLPEKEYLDFLCSLAIPFLSKDDNTLILSEKDADSIGEKLVGMLMDKSKGMKIGLSDERARTAGGLIVKSGDIQINLTLEAMTRVEREKLETEVVGILFESE